MQRLRSILRDPYRLLEGLLGLLLVYISADATIELIRFHPVGVDIEIPLRAAERWLAGGEPYPLAAFEAGPGRELPFLYAPYVLPLVAPLTPLPTGLVIGGALLVSVGLAAWAVRRLGVAWPLVPVVLLWPPFVEGIVGTNVEFLGFAALAALAAPAAQRDRTVTTRPTIVIAALTAATVAFKAAQVHVLAWMAFRRPRAAILAVAGIALLALVTVPLVGIDTWFAWLASGTRASDPTWPVIGAPLSTIVPRPVALLVTGVSIVLATRVGLQHGAAWLGLLIVAGAPTLHLFGFVYLLPALLLLRRDLALAFAALVATAVSSLLWIAVAACAVALLASRWWPRILRDTAES